jgi:phosphoesterase RecJ-like protein
MKELANRLADAREILALTHVNPDGDGLGSMLALAWCARAVGKTARVLVQDRVPWRYEFLFENEHPAGAGMFDELARAADAIVVVDTCAFSQLSGLEDALRAHRGKILVLDHHRTTDGVGGCEWIDPSAAATGVMMKELLESLAWPMNAAACDALATALVSDTGWLRFSNTDARCLRAFADLVQRGVRTDVLYDRIYQSDRPQRLRLMTRALENLELHCGGRLAVMSLSKADFELTGATKEETENLINEALRLKSVEVAVMAVENGGVVRVSLRSRHAVDVSELAKKFGGGGHARAAGLRLSEPLDVVKRRIVEACSAALG